MQFSADGSYVITASLDKTAKLVDVTTLEVLKTYKTGRFVQSAAVSPILDHVLLGGGQDASQVRGWGRGGGTPGAQQRGGGGALSGCVARRGGCSGAERCRG